MLTSMDAMKTTLATTHENVNAIHTDANELSGFSFSLRRLAMATFALLALSHVFLLGQSVSSWFVQRSYETSLSSKIVLHWQVSMSSDSKQVNILSQSPGVSSNNDATGDDDSASSGSNIAVEGVLAPGELVTTYGEATDEYHLLLEPIPGFISRLLADDQDENENENEECLWSTKKTQAADEAMALSSLMYAGRLTSDPHPATGGSQLMYAPAALVIAQQLWNAAQVFYLLLMVCLVFESSSCQMSPAFNNRWKRVTIVTVFLCSFIFLPFSVYIVSPGGHIFAFLMLICTIFTIVTPMNTLRVAIAEEKSKKEYSSTLSSWMVTREETIAFLCNLGSSIYNFRISRTTWPHWKSAFESIDTLFGWESEGYCKMMDSYFTLGLKNIHIPLWVSRAHGSTTAMNLFLWIWSVLPLLYVSYFLCMFAVAPLSPGVRVQRGLCAFALCHFLFFTDIVAYRYGRGYNNTHDHFFHWLEKFCWRIAILLPIYQNCTNGHWENGHKRRPHLGIYLRYGMMAWGVFFFVVQVLMVDVIRFTQHMLGYEEKGLIYILGLDQTPVLKWFQYPYHPAMVTMWLMYGFLHVTGFSLYGIFLSGNKKYETVESCQGQMA